MGMFDIVTFECPECGEAHSLQITSGPCNMNEYCLTTVPTKAVPELLNEYHYCTCGERIKLELYTPPKLVAVVESYIKA
jgi:hypothetical protein